MDVVSSRNGDLLGFGRLPCMRCSSCHCPCAWLRRACRETEDVFRRVRKGEKYAMKGYAEKLSKQLMALVGKVRAWSCSLACCVFRDAHYGSACPLLSFVCCSMVQVREDIPKNTRIKVNTLLIVDVHARDIIDGFVRDSILDTREFAWESQLRFYWDRDRDDIVIKQCTGAFQYGYEYMGECCRLPTETFMGCDRWLVARTCGRHCITFACCCAATRSCRPQRPPSHHAPDGPLLHDTYPGAHVQAGRLPCWPRRHWQDGDGQGPRQEPGAAVLRHQLRVRALGR